MRALSLLWGQLSTGSRPIVAFPFARVLPGREQAFGSEYRMSWQLEAWAGGISGIRSYDEPRDAEEMVRVPFACTVCTLLWRHCRVGRASDRCGWRHRDGSWWHSWFRRHGFRRHGFRRYGFRWRGFRWHCSRWQRGPSPPAIGRCVRHGWGRGSGGGPLRQPRLQRSELLRGNPGSGR